MRAALCVFDYAVRGVVKKYWREMIMTRERTRERNNARLATLQRITRAKRWLCFDIEVDYVPHERKVETITMIGATLFDHAHDAPIEHRLFTRIAARRSECRTSTTATNDATRQEVVQMSLQPIVKRCEEDADDITTTFKVLHFRSEYDMLKEFMQYARDARIHGLCYFNGHKFDMPFIELRLSTLSAVAGDGLYPTVRCPGGADSNGKERRKRYMPTDDGTTRHSPRNL